MRVWVVKATRRPIYPRGKERRLPILERFGGPHGRLGRVLKISPLSGFDPRTDWAIPANTVKVKQSHYRPGQAPTFPGVLGSRISRQSVPEGVKVVSPMQQPPLPPRKLSWYSFLLGGTRWRSWLRHCSTSRKVAVSIPDGVIRIFNWHNPSGRTMALGLTQPLTVMSKR